jgi:MSHA type pilus biogenesis protein MshL
MNFKTIAFLLVMSPLAALAQDEIQSALQKPVPFFSQDGEPLPAVLQSIGRAHGISIVADDDVKGTVSVEMNNTTVKGVLDAILRPSGYYYEVEEGWISVSRFKTVLYAFDYPQITRTGSSSSSISLGGQGSNGSSGAQGGMNYTGAGGAGLNQAVNGSGGSGSGNDSAQIQIQQKTDSDFWQSIEAQIKSMLAKDESFVVNQFSGLVQVKASARTHRDVSDFVGTVNERIGAQVEIVAKIIEVHLTDQNKLGIDWQSAAFSIGKTINVGTPVVPPGGVSVVQGLTGPNSNALKAGGFEFAPDTFAGTIGAGKVDVVIQALSEQGDVKVTSQPRLRLLNNQTGYIKDATDQPFFKMLSTVTINAGGTTNGGTQPITQTQYNTQIISIGTVLPVTAQISADNEVTLDVTPALTRLQRTEFSPDGLQTAPVLSVKQTSTIVRVQSGDTAIIGGLITDSSAATQRSVPGLGKIPFIGALFRSNIKATDRTELVIFLTPTVVPNHKKSAKPVQTTTLAVVTPASTVESIPVR